MLNSVSYSDKIILFWDIPVNYAEGDIFLIKLNGSPIGETTNFHFEAVGLSENTKHDFELIHMHTNGAANKIGLLTCWTISRKNLIDITKSPYNAKGDGKTLNTKAIQKAINDCGKNDCVYIPNGDFMSGSLYLHSDMEIYLEKDAVLHGTSCETDYEPKIWSRFEGIELMSYAGLLNIGVLERNSGYSCRNVRIYGEGTICGGGIALAENVIEKEKILMKDYMASLGEKINECEKDVTIPGRVRPRLINMSCAQNIIISGITIMNGACWNVHMIYSDNIITHGCTFRSEKVWNGDGWNPDSSTNCVIFGCEFYTGDDAVAIKSGKNPEGNIINRPCEHIRIFDCTSHFGHGITIGSEMSGGINDVHIWNCDMKNSVYGIEIKATKKRGGYVRNIHAGYSCVCRVLMHSVGYNDDGDAAPEAPVFEDCIFENLKVTAGFMDNDGKLHSCEAIELSGFDIPGHYIKNVRFRNIVIDSGVSQKHSVSLQCCDGISFENISCK